MRYKVVTLFCLIIALGFYLSPKASCDLTFEGSDFNLPAFSPSAAFYDKFYTLKNSREFKNVRGMILPHHLIVGDKIAEFLTRAFGSYDCSIKKIVLIGPDHFGMNFSAFSSTDQNFSTPYGVLPLEKSEVSSLFREGFAELNNQAFIREHSLSSITPFLKKHFPSSRVLPILTKLDIDDNDVDNLVSYLSNYIDDTTLVIASVDFSHYTPYEVAIAHDKMTYSAMTQLDYERLKKAETDSNQTLILFLKLMNKLNSLNIVDYLNTNSMDVVGHNDPSLMTSHQFYTYAKGEPLKPFNFKSILFVPDDTSNIAPESLERILMGNDYIIRPSDLNNDNSFELEGKVYTIDDVSDIEVF